MKLKGGHTTEDPRLDRIPQPDPRNAEYPIAAIVGDRPLRSRSWPCRPRLDQGREGACVGFGFSHELAAQPSVVKGVDDSYAQALYKRAQLLDEWPGENYSGTSVLAGAKAVTEKGLLAEYRWATTVDDVLRTLSVHGPVVLGVDWYDTAYEPRPSGLLDLSGRVVGGHCILARGILLSGRLRGERAGEPVIRLRNSWGEEWGRRGDAFLKASDLERLLSAGGDACVPVRSKR